MDDAGSAFLELQQKISDALRNIRNGFRVGRQRNENAPRETTKHAGSKNHSKKRDKSRAVLEKRSRRINGKYGKGLKKR